MDGNLTVVVINKMWFYQVKSLAKVQYINTVTSHGLTVRETDAKVALVVNM